MKNIISKYNIKNELVLDSSTDYLRVHNVPDDKNVEKLKKDLEGGTLLSANKRLLYWKIDDTSSKVTTLDKNWKPTIEIAIANTIVNSKKVLYHWTKKDVALKILTEGLIIQPGARKMNRLSYSVFYNYKASFLTSEPNQLKKIQAFKKYKYPEYTLLEIEIPQGVAVYHDPNMSNEVQHYLSRENDFCFAIFDNIPNTHLKLLGTSKGIK
jgi:hypothetical protein